MLDKQKRIKIFRKWIKALRSGKYKKTTGVLNKGNKYCCLGVLCEVAHKELGLTITEGKRKLYDGNSTLPPLSVANKLGFETTSVKLLKPIVGETSYTELNDSKKGYGFKKIANLVEAQFLKPLLKK